jgi:putative hydrolase of the HAD superfamily
VSEIKNVVFDVGRVLIDFCYVDFFNLLRQRGAEIVDEEDFSAQVGLIGYECGEISNSEFLNRVNELMNDPLPDDQLVAAWNSLFTSVPAMLNFAKGLKAYCRVYLLSNTSALHWEYLQQQFSLHQYCHDLLASYQVGYMKPAAEIFTAAAEQFNIDPEATVFVDDKQENVAGALACGWNGIWHRDRMETTNRLRELTGRDV